MIPLPLSLNLVKLLPYAIVAVVFAGVGYKTAATIYTAEVSKLETKIAKIEKAQAELIAKNKELEVKAAEKTVEVVTKYVDRIKYVKVKGDTIIKEVPIYVTQKANADCPVTDGWVYIHDRAANSGRTKGEVPKAPKNPDGTTTRIRLSDTAETVVINYAKYHAVSEQLLKLQEWIREQERIHNSK